MSELDDLIMWINLTKIESLRIECINEDGSISIPDQTKVQLSEVLRYAKSILALYQMGAAYNNWLVILLDVLYLEVFNIRCKGDQKECKFKYLLSQLDFLFPRIDSCPFFYIG
ncbi:hypothetical protein QIA17_05295 (plasmid) [Borreliella californiensis]|uniref:Uncharacterized protein n=1 Tax=Borreliella californiensis TaxID=373543 RepID=A0A7X0DPV7_9SPIR|nr:hypothetical protein [Borreliella californiensis]MBB6213603.1 hypothetical protein [Borreliella californiensis]MBB6213644.1 hypothetical protein [Borreliella californiensis]